MNWTELGGRVTENVDYSNVFGYGSDGVDLNIEYDSLNNIDLVVSREDVPAGRYQASNSFGVTKTVQRINRRTMAIFEREAQQWELLFTLRREDQLLLGPTVMSIDMPPERARLMKKELAASVVVKLKRPFRAIGHRLVSPTLEEATEINETIDVIIADILYVLITDRSNLVLASFKTR